MNIESYLPRPQLVTKATTVATPRFPVIDAHNHLCSVFGGFWHEKPIREFLDVLDRAHVRWIVDLDGGWGDEMRQRHRNHFALQVPDRVKLFGGVDWEQWQVMGDEFPQWAAEQFRQQVLDGVAGLKIWKPFGLHIKNAEGVLAQVDDARLDPIWAMAGKMGVPVLVHVGDPIAFFDPIDAHNERYEELHAHPDWHFPAPTFPPVLSILNAFKNVTVRHAGTKFIIAHVGCYAENLGWVSQWLDACPNVSIDFSARIAELGRQPYSARKFFIKYADRIVFGTDIPVDVAMYQLYYRFLESDDEYFDYSHIPGAPPQGRWQIYGLYLPDDVLAKVYYKNAERLFR
ncbi:MAG: hypothetical protein RLZZ297_71 [Chloroflexota bacterium]|jgi:predicted TIM-barrel fold metal-dependent hydrolase